jgi:hypothetical protein
MLAAAYTRSLRPHTLVATDIIARSAHQLAAIELPDEALARALTRVLSLPSTGKAKAACASSLRPHTLIA